MSDFDQGGVTGGTVPMVLDPDECILDRAGQCQREDERHFREPFELHAFGSSTPIRSGFGRCEHPTCHVEPVRSFDGEEIVARLCRHCDAQLPA